MRKVIHRGLWITFFALGEGLFLHPWRQKRTLTELLSGRFCTKSVERLHEAVDNLWITRKKLWITYPQAPVDNFGPTGGISEGVRKWLIHMGIRDQTVLAALVAVLMGSVGFVSVMGS